MGYIGVYIYMCTSVCNRPLQSRVEVQGLKARRGADLGHLAEQPEAVTRLGKYGRHRGVDIDVDIDMDTDM